MVTKSTFEINYALPLHFALCTCCTIGLLSPPPFPDHYISLLGEQCLAPLLFYKEVLNVVPSFSCPIFCLDSLDSRL